jgi:hypothetical protein
MLLAIILKLGLGAILSSYSVDEIFVEPDIV